MDHGGKNVTGQFGLFRSLSNMGLPSYLSFEVLELRCTNHPNQDGVRFLNN
jgi:hypothetical protein